MQPFQLSAQARKDGLRLFGSRVDIAVPLPAEDADSLKEIQRCPDSEYRQRSMDKIFRCGTAALHTSIYFPDRRIKMGEIAFSVSGQKELPPRFLHAFQYRDRRP